MAVKHITYRGETFRIAYDIVNPQAPKDLIVLPGSGSDKTLMRPAFGKALKGWRHIYVDLPGFGKSDTPAVPLTTDDYAVVVERFLDAVGARKDAVAGHSFGGKVAVALMPKRLILLSSAGIVMPKPLKVRLKIALFKALKPFGGAKLRRFFASKAAAATNETMYETFKNVVDEDFGDRFAAYEGPALLCWGDRDTATPPEAGRTIAASMPRARLEFFDGDHYFFLQRPDEVIQKMEAFLETV